MIQPSRRRVAADSSSIILLQKVSLLERFLANYQVVIAGEVYKEITRPQKAGAAELQRLFMGAVQPAGENHIHKGMGRGESETICLYEENRAEFIIVDDKKAAQYCRTHDIPFINCLLLPRILHAAGCIGSEQCRGVLPVLIREGYYSKSIIGQAQDIAGPVLKRFYP